MDLGLRHAPGGMRREGAIVSSEKLISAAKLAKVWRSVRGVMSSFRESAQTRSSMRTTPANGPLRRSEHSVTSTLIVRSP